MNNIYLVKNQVYHAETKYIHVRFHFVREILDEGHIELNKINAKHNLVEMLTKVVRGTKFNHYKNYSASLKCIETF